MDHHTLWDKQPPETLDNNRPLQPNHDDTRIRIEHKTACHRPSIYPNEPLSRTGHETDQDSCNVFPATTRQFSQQARNRNNLLLAQWITCVLLLSIHTVCLRSRRNIGSSASGVWCTASNQYVCRHSVTRRQYKMLFQVTPFGASSSVRGPLKLAYDEPSSDLVVMS